MQTVKTRAEAVVYSIRQPFHNCTATVPAVMLAWAGNLLYGEMFQPMGHTTVDPGMRVSLVEPGLLFDPVCGYWFRVDESDFKDNFVSV